MWTIQALSSDIYRDEAVYSEPSLFQSSPLFQALGLDQYPVQVETAPIFAAVMPPIFVRDP